MAKRWKWDERPVMTVPEMAEVLHISNWLAWELVWRNEVRSVKLGTRRLVLTDSIKERLEVTA